MEAQRSGFHLRGCRLCRHPLTGYRRLCFETPGFLFAVRVSERMPLIRILPPLTALYYHKIANFSRLVILPDPVYIVSGIMETEVANMENMA